MKKNYYVVWSGRKTGIFNAWEECEESVKNYPNNGYKGVNTLEEAKQLLKDKLLPEDYAKCLKDFFYRTCDVDLESLF